MVACMGVCVLYKDCHAYLYIILSVCVQGSQRELLNLSQQDYANRIEELNQSLKEAWASDQKVKALKIVIQVMWHKLINLWWY